MEIGLQQLLPPEVIQGRVSALAAEISKDCPDGRLLLVGVLKGCFHFISDLSRQLECEVEYVGFEIPDEFVVGYGLDYGERFRNLPYIATLREGSDLPRDFHP